MKAGYIAPMSISAVNGGMRNQAVNTIKHISKFDVQPIQLSPWEDLTELDLDLIHVFGASLENMQIIHQICALSIPLALSPVFYANRSASVIKSTLQIEKIFKPISKAIRSDFSIKAELCKKADLILPNTQAEADIIRNAFSIQHKKISVIPNGVEERFKNASGNLFFEKYGLRDFVLFAGQAGAVRKNVIQLLKVAPKLDTQVVIIGSFYKDDYGDECIKLASKANNVTLIETLPHDSEMLASAYAASKVFVLPSQFETPGIAAMEAALTGSNIVITEKGGTKEYYLDFVEYIDPDSGSSLLNGIRNALKKEKSNDLENHISENYSWQRVAELTFKQYQRLLT